MDKNKVYKILFAEDVSTDREIVERILRKNEIQFVSECVDTEPEFKELLLTFNPDLILSDYQMPTFDGMRALKLAQEFQPDVPFVVITGSTNEDIAVECMKQGADDYVIKQNLKRLIPSIKSAIQKKKLELKERLVRKELEESELKYRLLVQNSPNAVVLIRFDEIVFINKRFESLFEYTIDELNESDFNLLSLFPDKYIKQFEYIVNNPTEQLKENIETKVEIQTKSGNSIFCEITAVPFVYEEANYVQAIIKDLSLQKLLLERNMMLSRAIEQTPVGVVITNKDAEIEYANPSFVKTTGYSFDEVIGQNPRFYSSGQHNKAFFEAMWAKLTEGKIWKGEIINKRKNGEHYPENLTISPIFNSENELTHYVAIKEDISEQKKYIADLKAAKEKAEESDRLKTAFLTNMSHEIRTPMNGILGFTDMLKEPDLTSDMQTEYIDIIQKSGQRMMNTISDLIDISKIESGLVEVQLKKVSVNNMLNDIFLLLKNEAQAKNLNFVLKENNKGKSILTDEEKLYSIITNVIKNAIKFTLTGEVRLGYLISEHEITFTISDTGIGIPEDRKKAVFDRFVQADIEDSKVFEGSGLGLSIAKSYVELLNGKIWFESEVDKGTTFYISLPLNANTDYKQPGTIAAGVKPEDERLKNLNILIVEDDQATILLTKKIVERISKQVFVKSNGYDAIDFIRAENDVDLILMDIMLPKLDGFEATKGIREFNKEIKIIAQTAFAQESDSLTAFEVGCDNYITKPFTKTELLNIIQETMLNDCH
ncbi:DUF2153 family protein [uncultured Draconibacterium sp.]|uniref:DUF2153 family protein n=1 Tax=uncultured Draconibacterium sp. TaxID=1573823 RepID=UPI0032605AA5